MKHTYVVGNLKMNLLSHEEAERYLAVLRRETLGKHFEQTLGVLCPPTLFLNEFDRLPKSFVRGAQNAHAEKEGAYTGEISPQMLRNEGVEYVILGHSERRQYAHETDEEIREKVRGALRFHLRPILCIGETREERDRGDIHDVLDRQLRVVFEGMSKLQAEKVLVAYEPRWAIGGDIPPTTQEIFQVRIFLRKWFTEQFDAATAQHIPMLYGGSVKSSFLGAVSWEAEMDGVLVGRESLFPHELVKMMLLFEDHAKQNATIETESL